MADAAKIAWVLMGENTSVARVARFTRMSLMKIGNRMIIPKIKEHAKRLTVL